ncbi:dimethylglycine dehydrogenase [Jhaorihella thermophila]|uniref:Dimethylglycine dehydrogenase n=1 Tax=Jhaorihella thermophila TaxID=488547 RepID=A0A1H5SEN0_9RHOB|nr:dimethylglycine dehydrogenase [Jhaorihella thermophila]
MRTRARTVVIGGSVNGCSILCRLTRLAWRDVVLLERDELTSGSTWHAASNIHRLHDSTDVSRIQHYAMRLYKALEQETGQSCGVFQLGALYIAETKHAHQLRLHVAKAKLQGVSFTRFRGTRPSGCARPLTCKRRWARRSG